MGKKGFFGEAGGWILGLLLVFIIISILVSPKKLYAQAKDTVFNFGSNFLPKEKFPQSLGESKIPLELEQYYKSLALKIKNSGEGNNCWIKIDKMPKTEGFSIALYNNEIGIQKISSRGLTPPEKSEPIENFKPCSIKGDKAKKFYDCVNKKSKQIPSQQMATQTLSTPQSPCIAGNPCIVSIDNPQVVQGQDVKIILSGQNFQDGAEGFFTPGNERIKLNYVSDNKIYFEGQVTSQPDRYYIQIKNGDGKRSNQFKINVVAPATCPDAYEEEKSIIINEKTNIAEFLFKFDNSHVCVVYLDGNNLNIEKIQKAYPDCSKTLISPPQAAYDAISNTVKISWKKMTKDDKYYAVFRTHEDALGELYICDYIEASQEQEYNCVDKKPLTPKTKYTYNVHTYSDTAELQARVAYVDIPAT